MTVLFATIFAGWAQKEEIRVRLKSNATVVKVAYRMNNVGDELTIDLGKGQLVTLKQETDELIRTEIAITEPSAETREMVIAADKLKTLRLVNGTSSIEGITSMVSNSLEVLNLDNTKLSETPNLDFRQLSKVKEITLNECDVEEVILPEKDQIETFQASPQLFSKKGLKKAVNLEKQTVLATLGLKGCAMDTIDLSNAPNIKQLVIHGIDTKTFPKALLGAKAMKKLTLVNLQFCGFGYHELPDMNDTELENFVIKNFYAHTINKKYRKNMEVDLSYMKSAKGMAESVTPTQFRWQHKGADGKTWEDVPAEHYTEKDGVFTFKKSIFADGEKTHNMRCLLFNPAYGEIGFYKKTGHYTYTIGVTYPTLTFKTEIPAGESISFLASPVKGSEEPLTFEGVEEVEFMNYKVTSPTITISGPVGSLILSDCKVTEIDLSNSLSITSMIMAYNKVKSVDLSNNLNLEVFMAPENSELSEVILSNHEKMTGVYLYKCALKDGINLNAIPNVVELSLSGNKISSLDLKPLTKLEMLLADNNNLTELDLSYNAKLKNLSVSGNQFENLSVAGLKDLKEVFIYGNELRGANMTTIMNELPRRAEADKARIMVVDTERQPSDKNLCSENDVKIAAGKHWMVYDYKGGVNDGNGVEYKGFDVANQEVTPEEIALWPNPATDYIYIRGNAFAPVMLIAMDGKIVFKSHLDVSGNAEISVKGLPRGQYIVSVNARTYKLIVE